MINYIAAQGMRRSLTAPIIFQLLSKHILQLPPRQLELDRIVLHYRQAYSDYHEIFKLPELTKVEQHQRQFYFFIHTLNHNLPQEDRMFESELDQSYLEHLEIPRCGAIIKKKVNKMDYYLLVTDRRTLLKGFPKGKLELEQSYEECAKRETMQQTGYKIALDPSKKIEVVISTTTFLSKPYRRRFTFYPATLLPNQPFNYIKRCEGDDYHSEITQFQWIPEHKLRTQRLTYPTKLALMQMGVSLEARPQQ